MKLLSTTPLPSSWDPSQTDGPPFFYRSIANHSYIVISIDDGSIHILSSRDGTLLPNQPPKGLTGDAKVAQVLLDGENLILGQGTPPALTVYNIPSGRTTDLITLPSIKGVFILTILHRDENSCIVAAFDLEGDICVFDIRTNKHLHTTKLHDEIAHLNVVHESYIATSSPDGTFAVSSWSTGEIVWKKQVGQREGWIAGKRTGNAVFAQMMYEGKVALGTKDGTVRVFDLESGEQITEWKAADGMTQHLILYNECLLQVSWGEMKIWSKDTYHLLKTVRMFDRAATNLVVVGDVVIACGRDASMVEDGCGLDEGLKGWKVNLKDGGDGPKTAIEGKDKNKKLDSTVFAIGPPLRAARALHSLEGNRVAICVLRGETWFVQIWQV